MAWTGMNDGKSLPDVLFEGTFNGDVHLDFLQNTMRPFARVSGARKQYWYQHDGAPCNDASSCTDFLKSKFESHFLSRNLEHKWPVTSRDLRPLDFWLWNQVTSYQKKKSHQKAWKAWNVVSKMLQPVWKKKLTGRCVDTPETELLHAVDSHF